MRSKFPSFFQTNDFPDSVGHCLALLILNYFSFNCFYSNQAVSVADTVNQIKYSLSTLVSYLALVAFNVIKHLVAQHSTDRFTVLIPELKCFLGHCICFPTSISTLRTEVLFFQDASRAFKEVTITAQEHQ